MTEPIASGYQRPTISASRLKAVGGEKGEPGCERKLAGAYLFDLKQSGSDATEFGTAVHAIGEHHQLTGEILDPESEASRVYTAGAHLVTLCGKLLVEHEHIGELPDGSPYVAYIDGHSARASETTNTLVIQDLKTTSNANFALQGDDGESAEPPPLTEATARGPYALRKDIQGILYAWILLAAPAHWFAPCLPDGVQGPRHWQWWDPAERGVRPTTTGRLRWVYFLTRGVARAWEVNDWITPAAAAAALEARIMPLVAKINAVHEWHYGRVTGAIPGGQPRLDEIDRTLDACRDRRRGTYGRWCGAGEHDACNFDQIGTPVLDLVQLRVRKTMTPQERLAEIRNRKGGAAAAAPAPQETPAASPPPTADLAPTTAPEAQPAPSASQPDASSAPETTGQSAAAELTKGQKAAATRAAKKAASAPPAAPPIAGNINPPEVLEALAKLAENPVGLAATSAELTAPLSQHTDEQGGKHSSAEAAVPAYEVAAPARPARTASPVVAPAAEALGQLTVGQVCDALIAAGYVVSLSVEGAAQR
jgi:hypothetical protein